MAAHGSNGKLLIYEANSARDTTRSVRAVLAQDFNIHASGNKATCPKCKREGKLWIAPSDARAKCFYAGCDFDVTPRREGASLSGVLAELFALCHAELVKQGGGDNSNDAYHYLHDRRGVEPQVTADFPLGVVPDSVDVDGLFNGVLKEAEAAVAAEEKEKKHRVGRPPRTDQPGAAEKMEWLQGRKTALVKLLNDCRGWVMFFYTDPHNHYTAIRLRKPFSSECLSFTTGGKFGLFGQHVPAFGVGGGGTPAPYEGQMLALEGEFNLLVLQSHRVREAVAATIDPSSNYLHACAVGGVNNADVGALAAHAEQTPLLVCIDHDANGAGEALRNAVLQRVACTICTTPDENSDLDSFLEPITEISDRAAALQSLFENAVFYPRPIDAVLNDLQGLRAISLKIDQLAAKACPMLLEDITSRADFFRDELTDQAYYIFDRDTKKLIPISLEHHDFWALVKRYGILPSDPLFKPLYETLLLHARDNGKKVGPGFYAVYRNTSGPAVYIHNADAGIIRITADTVGGVDNGTDGVVFLDRGNVQPFNLQAKSQGLSSALFDHLIKPIMFKSEHLSIQEQRVLGLIWFFSLFFVDMFPTKPILAIVGEKGSGKSSMLRAVGRTCYGSNFDVSTLSEDVKDFEAAVCNNHFVAFDNVDGDKTHLNDRLASAATGATKLSRELYTTNTVVKFKYHAYIGITSRTPQFKRDDIAQRLLLLMVATQPGRSYVPEAALRDRLASQRDAMMSEAVYFIQEILAQLAAARDHAQFETEFRMADFAYFATLVGRAAHCEPMVAGILKKLAGVQKEFTLSGEPIVELLELWTAKSTNPGRWVDARTLATELTEISSRQGIAFKEGGSAATVGQKLAQLHAELNVSFVVESKKGHAGKAFYKFALRQQQAAAA